MIRELFSDDDWRLMRRITKGLALLFVLTAGLCHVQQTYSQKFADVTGDAKWIWAQRAMSSNEPIAFFAARDLDVPEKRLYTRIKIAGDPEYSLWVNGRRVASRRAPNQQRVLDLIDVSDLVHTGPNRIVVGLRSPQGFGGLIVAVDLAPEVAAWVVTDEHWRIYRRWDPRMLLQDLPGRWQPPLVLGEPPIGKWDFLPPAERKIDDPAEEVVRPRRSYPSTGLLPAIRTTAGIAIAVADRVDGTVFDFGFTRGRVRLELQRPAHGNRLVQLRFANDASELERVDWNLRPVVFAPEESVVTTAEETSFRYAMVFAKNVQAEVVRKPSGQ